MGDHRREQTCVTRVVPHVLHDGSEDGDVNAEFGGVGYVDEGEDGGHHRDDEVWIVGAKVLEPEKTLGLDSWEELRH